MNPWGFAKHFNNHVEFDPAFHDLFKGRRLLVEGKIVEKAETQPMPDHEPLEEKSPRVVALQLLKRNRDIAWRAPSRTGRKPPAIALNAMALEAGPVHPSLLDEVIAIATHIRGRLRELPDRAAPCRSSTPPTRLTSSPIGGLRTRPRKICTMATSAA